MAEEAQPELNSQQMLRVRLSAAWASVMFLYAYSDLLGLYDQKLLESILDGQMPMFGPITPELRLGIAVMMSIPTLMVFVCVVARRSFAIWTNVAFGILYTIIILATMVHAPIYYKYFGLLEVGLTVYAALTAYRWKKQ